MPQGKGTYGSKVGRPPAKRARSMPLTDKQAKAAIQALRDDAGKKAYRKKEAAKKNTTKKTQKGQR